MTGRRGRLVCQPDGTVKYQLRSQADATPVEMLNLVEKEAFMNGDKVGSGTWYWTHPVQCL